MKNKMRHLIMIAIFLFVGTGNLLAKPAGSLTHILLLLLETDGLSMMTPYVNREDMAGIHEAYSEDDNCPWGFAHNGIDFFPLDDPHKLYTAFQAVAAGTIETAVIHKNHYDGKIFYQVNVSLRINQEILIWYAFEPFTNNPADGDTQLDAIDVVPGQKVTAGEIIGRLYNPSTDVGAHVHFGVTINHEWVCPEDYFSPQAHASVLELLRTTHPNANICYFAD